jgi:adenosylcobinamide-GDP ribazoletransferase
MTFPHLRLAFGFLTVLPVRTRDVQPGELGRAGRWFPLVGLVLGALLAGLNHLAGWLFPPLVAAALVTAAWAVLTGMLHLDGLADCCDGLLVAGTREQRLEIMRDPRRGAFAVIGLSLFLVLKVLAIAALPKTPLPWLRLAAATYALLFAPVLARWLLVLAACQPQARPGGLGDQFAEGVTPATLAAAAVLPGALLVVGGWPAVIAAVCAAATAGASWAFARARLGGVTGDVLGLTVEFAELSVLLVFTSEQLPL